MGDCGGLAGPIARFPLEVLIAVGLLHSGDGDGQFVNIHRIKIGLGCGGFTGGNKHQQASKVIASLIAKRKTLGIPTNFLPLLHNVLLLLHTEKLEEDIYLISSSVDEAFKRPRSAEQSFVWQDGREKAPAIVKRLRSEAPNLEEHPKRKKVMNGLQFFKKIARMPLLHKAHFYRS